VPEHGGWATWRVATERALYGPAGFYRRRDGRPRDHFRTSVHASPLFAEAVLRLLRDSGLSTLVDMGSGGGELLAALHAADPSLRLVGVDVADRPPGLPAGVEWAQEMPDGLEGLVLANEWLDDVPVEVVELGGDGPRVVEVGPRGAERLGGAPAGPDAAWLGNWWPLREVGDRAEVGLPRDERWAAVVASLRRGVAVAVDYAHHRDDRPPRGTLAGYRGGRLVPPVPDGTCDVTSHVALDACAAAGAGAGAASTVLTTQRAALRALGGRRERPPHARAGTDPAGYLAALAERGEAAELTDPGGLGAFGWLAQSVRMPLPGPLADLGRGRQPQETGTDA
jgi:SAM-dependent MidA family methyltransferase